LLPVLPMFAVILAVAQDRAASGPNGSLIAAATVAALFLAVISSTLNPNHFSLRAEAGSSFPYKVVRGQQTADAYLGTFVGGYGAMQYLNSTYHGQAQIWSPQLSGARL